MALADTLAFSVQGAYNAIHADVWTVLGPGDIAGTTFSGDAQTESPVVMDTDLGADAREKTMLYVDRPAPAFTRNLQISGKGARWRIVGDVDDNPANYRVKFEIVKIAEGKDL